MGIFDVFKRNRGHPESSLNREADTVLQVRGISLDKSEAWCPVGYTKLSDVPEIKAGIRKIAELMSVMPLHLLENTSQGNVRVNNELSRKLDVTPCKYLSRPQWITNVVKDMILNGNSFGIPVFKGRLLDYIIPVTTGGNIIQNGMDDYAVIIDGITYDPDEILHFSYNAEPECPWRGCGLKTELRGVIGALAQARKTAKTIMERPMPAIAVRTYNLGEDLSTSEGRREIADRFISSVDAGTPWVISAENFELQQIKPMSLSDLAIRDDIEINTRAAAAILGVPAYVLGVGEFKQDEYNNFVSTKLLPLAVLIEQELTRKLINSPSYFIRFSNRQLYSYTMEERLNFSTELYDRGILSGNEVRMDFDLEPVEGLDERKVLENYIPIDMTGKQKKLNGGE